VITLPRSNKLGRQTSFLPGNHHLRIFNRKDDSMSDVHLGRREIITLG